MANQNRHRYDRPSVSEAIVEVKFNYEASDAAIPGQVFEKIRSSYPKKKNLELITFVIGSVDAATKPTLPPQAPVMQAWKNDDSEVIQVGPGIIAANRMRYSSWEDFLPSVRMVLSAYIDSASPKFVTRLGVRYINRFFIPEPTIKLVDYFNLGVAVPTALSNTMTGFDLTFIHRITKTQKTGSEFEVRTKFLSDALLPGEVGNRFILDIDCYIDGAITPDVSKIVALSNEAHESLGLVFESVITDKVRKIMGVKA